MFFEKLVEQHRVHRLVTDADDLAFRVTRYQIGIDFFYFLSYQAELWDAVGVEIWLVSGTSPAEAQGPLRWLCPSA